MIPRRVLVAIALAVTAAVAHADVPVVRQMSFFDANQGVDGTVYATAYFQGAYVVAGQFTHAGDVPVHNIAAWDGACWHDLGGGLTRPDSALCRVRALTVAGGRLIAGGTFTVAGGVAAPLVAAWDGTAWAKFGPSLAFVATSVNCLLPRGDRVYAGTTPVQVADGNTYAVTWLAGGDGNWHADWDGCNAGWINALAPDPCSGWMFAGGSITRCGAYGIGAQFSFGAQNFGLNGPAPASCPDSFATNGEVRAVAVHQSSPSSWDVWIGGMFTGVSLFGAETPAHNICRLHWDGTAYSVDALAGGTDKAVNTIAVDAAGIAYIGGEFVTAGGTGAAYCAVWNDGAQRWDALGGGLRGPVRTLGLFGAQTLVAGGSFLGARNVSGGATTLLEAHGVAFFDLAAQRWSACEARVPQLLLAASAPATARDAAWHPRVSSTGGAPALANVGGHLVSLATYALPCDGGTAEAIGLTPLPDGIAGLDTDGPVGQIVAWGGGWAMRGAFQTVNGVAANGLAWFDGTAWQGFASVPNGSVASLAAVDGVLYAAGSFGTASGAVNVARWDGTAWQPLGAAGPNGSGPNGAVTAMTAHGGLLVVTGSFTAVSGVPAGGIAAFDRDTETWQPLGSGEGLAVTARVAGTGAVLLSYGGQLYVGGDFTTVDGIPAAHLARWDGAAWTGLSGGLDGTVRALAGYNGYLLAGGAFAQADGMPAAHLARWDGVAWSALPGLAFDGEVTALATDDTVVAVAGTFATVDGAAAPPVVAWMDSGVVASPGQIAAVDAPGATPGRGGWVRDVAAGPLPFAAQVVTRFTLPRAAVVHAMVVDARGAVVRHWPATLQAAGAQRLVWRGDTDAGAAAPAGVYFLCLEAPGRPRATLRMVRR